MFEESEKEIYYDLFAYPIPITSREIADEDENHLSVHFIMVDSTSQSNFIRLFNESLTVLNEMDYYIMDGFNKIGENTFPVMNAVFLGRYEWWIIGGTMHIEQSDLHQKILHS